MTMFRNLSGFALVLLLCLCAASQNKPDYRRGFGEPRATIMESVLKEILPNAQFRWDPQLVGDTGDGSVARIQFPGFVFRPASDGNIDGATGSEVGTAKQDFVFASKNFKPTNGSSLTTEMIVFRATPDDSGVPPVTNSVSTINFGAYAPALAASDFVGVPTHGFMEDQPYSIVSPAWNQIKKSLCPTCQ